MSQHTRYLIRLLAIVLIVYGGVELLLGIKSLWWTIRDFFYSSHITSLLTRLYYGGFIFFFNLVRPVAAILGGIGLFQQKKWGWIVSVAVCLVIFTLGFAGTINYAIASYLLRYVPLPPIPEGAQVVRYYSMIPNYITTLVSIVFVLLLNRKSVKQLFRH